MTKFITIGTLLFSAVALAVPGLANLAAITGEITESCTVNSRNLGIEPPMTLYRLHIVVESCEPLDGPLMIDCRAGQELSVFSREALPAAVLGKRVRFEAELAGDERGERIWLRRAELLP